ncbi:DUF3085 domain-containing protein [Burkholderia sp. Bp9012]|uniref:DUF3085 domain-containing protein n=1 Tax=Burkholderia sp. Bp9012 TaxID=2184562 RepID=UPI002687009E
MLRFKNADMRRVLVDALAKQCEIFLVKDRGVYFMPARGERLPNGSTKHLAYAVGCNPAIDPFEQWYDLAHREMGGDDSAESFDPTSALFTRILTGRDDLVVSATIDEFVLELVPPQH